MLLIHKHSYRAKDEIKQLGGKWKPEEKGWEMPNREAYIKALAFCDAFNKADVVDSDSIEDIEGHRRWGLTDEQKTSATWMFPKLNQSDLDANPIPAKENVGAKVVSGLQFKGRLPNPRDIWIVMAYKADWGMFSETPNSFCCMNQQTRAVNFLTEDQIRQHTWLDKDLDKAKDMYFRFFVEA